MPTIDGCTFVENVASERGGAIYNNLCTPTITACEFTDNRSEGSGGAMFFAFYASPTLEGCTFEGQSLPDAFGCEPSGQRPASFVQ
jgi:predicted outer membrane repeat protein